MSIDRPPRPPLPRITPQVAQAIFNWLRSEGYGFTLLTDLYLQDEAYSDFADALIELEDRYELAQGTLTTDYERRLRALGERHARGVRRLRGIPIASLPTEQLVRFVPDGDVALAFLHCLPEPELLTALELGAYSLAGHGTGAPDLFGYLEKVFRARGLPYNASASVGIRWVGEPAVSQHAIEPALSALADPRLVDARDEFDKARGELRRGKLKDAGKAAGDAVETTMSVVLDAHGHQQPQTPGGHDLVQAGKLFDAMKAKHVGLLDQERDHALIFAAIKVRHTCGHGAGANPTPPDQSYVEAGVAAAAVAIAYLASKLPG